MAGTLFIVATPIGNLDDITARALRVLREVDVIAAEDTRRTAHLLTRYGITTRTTSLHEHNEAEKTPALIERLRSGENIALVSDAGTPLLSDPGQHLIRAAVDAQLRIEPIPGPSAIVTALAASGFAAQPFLFLGFPPIRASDLTEWLERLASAAATVVFFESPHRIRLTLEQIRERVGDIDIMVARELTKTHETLVRGQISTVMAQPNLETGELTVVIDIGQLTNTVKPEEIPDSVIAEEVGQLTDNGNLTKRQAIQTVARKYRRRPNDVYGAVERIRRLAK